MSEADVAEEVIKEAITEEVDEIVKNGKKGNLTTLRIWIFDYLLKDVALNYPEKVGSLKIHALYELRRALHPKTPRGL